MSIDRHHIYVLRSSHKQIYFWHEKLSRHLDLGSTLTESWLSTTRQKNSFNCQVNDKKNMSFRHKSGLGSKKSKRQTTPTSDNLLPTPLNRNPTTRNRLHPSKVEWVDTLQSPVRTRQRHPTTNNKQTSNNKQYNRQIHQQSKTKPNNRQPSKSGASLVVQNLKPTAKDWQIDYFSHRQIIGEKLDLDNDTPTYPLLTITGDRNLAIDYS